MQTQQSVEQVRVRTRAPQRRRDRKGYVRPDVAAERAGVCEATVLRWLQAGVVAGRKVVARWWVDERDLDRLLGD